MHTTGWKMMRASIFVSQYVFVISILFGYLAI